MNNAKTKKLHEILEQDDLNGVSFNASKQQLKKLGYSDDEISIAVAHLPFDGKKNKAKASQEITDLYKNNPDAAGEVAKRLLVMDNEKQQRKARADTIGIAAASSFSRVPNPMELKHLISLAGNVGIPIFKIAFLGLFLTAIAYGLSVFELVNVNFVRDFIYVYLFFAGVYVFVALVLNTIRTTKRMSPQEPKARRAYYIKNIVLNFVIFITLAVVLGLLLFR